MFASMVCRKLLRMFLALIALYDLELHQMNVKAAYLLKNLKSEKKSIYMCILKSVTVKQSDRIMCWIVKRLYELKQSVRLWYKKLTDIIKNEKFWSINTDLSILISKNHNAVIIISVFVNDLLIASKTMHEVNCMKTVLNEAFQMSDLDEMWIIVDLRVIRD